MRVLIFGAGAIGSVFGGLLANAGHEVTLLGRAWHLDVVRCQGLRVSGLWGEHVARGVATATCIEAMPHHDPFDWVLVCVKSHQTAEAAHLLPSLLGPQTLVCAFQNGLGNYETLTARLPRERVALGRVIFGAEIEPGHARVTVCADEVRIGSPDGCVPAERIEQLAATLRASGIPAGVTTKILTVLWAKVLYNCALNGLSTLLEVPYGALLAHAVAARLIPRIIEEAYLVGAAHHVPLEPTTARAYLELLCTRLIPDTAAHHSSMLQDLRRGKPSEIESLNGAMVRLARQEGLEAPANALVTRLVHARERFAGIGG